MALEVAARGLVMELGKVVIEGPAADFDEATASRPAYLGHA